MLTQLIFVNDFSDEAAFDAAARGYLSHVLVKLESGLLYPVVFYDPIRLKQDMDELAAHGERFLADPGMIIVPEVSREAMESAALTLAAQGFFDHFVPTTMEMVNASRGHWPPPRTPK